MFVTPGVVVDGELVTTNLVDINLGIRILLGSSYYEDWVERGDVRRRRTRSATRSTSATRGTRRRSPSRRSATSTAATTRWVMSPRWHDKRTGDNLALDTGGGALARLWATALANKVDTPYVKATGDERADQPAQDARTRPSTTLEWKIPQWSNAIERDRARIYFVAYAAGMALHFLDRAFEPRSAPGQHEGVRGLRRPRRGDRLRLPRGGARRALAPPRDPRRQDRQLPPLPADAVERQPDGLLRHARALRGRGDGPADLRGGGPGRRSAASTSCARSARFDPCLPCGVHMYLGKGKTIRQVHSPMFGEHAIGRGLDTEARERVGGSRRCSRRWSAPRPGGPRDRDRARRRRCSTSTARGSRGSSATSPSATTARSRRRSPATSSSRTCCCCTGCIPCRWRRACAGRWTRCGPYLESHGGDVELLGDRGRRRAAAAGGQLQRLPLLDGDAEARDRGRDPARRRPTSSGSRPRGTPRRRGAGPGS